MNVLDADSLMTPSTLLALVERMQADPHLGILQTVPALIGQLTLFARLQQFASRVYGGVIARGVAAWSGDDGNYWGTTPSFASPRSHKPAGYRMRLAMMQR